MTQFCLEMYHYQWLGNQTYYSAIIDTYNIYHQAIWEHVNHTTSACLTTIVDYYLLSLTIIKPVLTIVISTIKPV